ncbi:MAG: peptide chain release factor 1 [Dehalococcoidales bacterium]|nr:peptide chain release factor 1 [Dehalococcoidales bacterium]
MLERLAKIEQQYIELEEEMASEEAISNPKKMQELAQERARLEELVALYRQYHKSVKTLEDTRAMLDDRLDEEMLSMVKQEIENLESEVGKQYQDLKLSLLPKDPNDEKDIIMEIRSGTGGEEAGLFAADLFRMYTRYAQIKGWVTDIINLNEIGTGGIREVIFEIRGRGAFSRLKYERGVHRVQRVPTTEASGRIHTSTATVAVLPVADEVEVDINQSDLRIDVFHSGGAGGQNVNKVATAIRITHLPTGIVVICQDERSQLKNKTKAMSVLRARLLDMEQRKQEGDIVEERRSQVGTAERVEKIRTYNFPQDRITDHRGGITLRNLPNVMEGNLDELLDSLAADEQAKLLESHLE